MEPPPGPVVVDDRVAGNSIQPGVHGTDLGPLDVSPVQAHEHVLGDVLGRGRIFDSSSDELDQLAPRSTPRHHPSPWRDDRWLAAPDRSAADSTTVNGGGAVLICHLQTNPNRKGRNRANRTRFASILAHRRLFPQPKPFAWALRNSRHQPGGSPVTVNRVQLALNVADLDAAVDFYRRMFGVEVHKRRPGYVNFVVADPPLKPGAFFEAPQRSPTAQPPRGRSGIAPRRSPPPPTGSSTPGWQR